MVSAESLKHKSIFEKYYIHIFFFAFFALNFLLKIISLDSRDIANDEPFSVFWAQNSLKEIYNMLHAENNPPLHFVLLHFWIKIFGIDPFSVRFLSLLFSALTASVIFLIGTRFFNRFTGIASGLIFSFTTMHVYFSHEARVYTLFAFLAAVSLYIFLRIAENPGSRKLYIWLLVANLLLIYSHYFGFFIIFMEVFSLMFTGQRKKMFKPLFFVFSGLAICYLPLLIIFIERINTATGGTWVSSPETGQIYGFLNLFINDRLNMLVLILLIIAGGILLVINKKLVSSAWSLMNEKTFLIYSWFFIPYFIMFLVSYRIPMFIDRYILYTSIPFYIFIAILINSIFQNKKLKIIASVIFIGSMIFTINLNPDNFRRMKDLVTLVKELKTTNSAVFIAPDYADLGFTYHYNPEYFKNYKNYKKLLKSENIFPVATETETASFFSKVFTKCIYIQAGSEFQDPDNKIYNYIAAKYRKVETHKVYQIFLVHDFSN